MLTPFVEKIKQGLAPTSENWNQFLVEAHARFPGMTSVVFAQYKTAQGLTSYELLAQTLNPLSDALVVDLACGDGSLFPYLLPHSQKIVGIDMSSDELNAARRAFPDDSRIELIEATAQALPLETESADAILCHMAFMLMLPLAPVVEEINRVLKPGGFFAAVVPDPSVKKGLFAELQNIKHQFLCAQFPAFKDVRSGDARTVNVTGMGELFPASKGYELQCSREDLLIKTGADGVWNLTKDTYFVSMLDSAAQEALRLKLTEFVSERTDIDGTISFEFPLQIFMAKKGHL